MSSTHLPIDQFWQRLIIIALIWVTVVLLYKVSNFNFTGFQKLIFRFIFLSYLITHFVGTSIIFVFGEDALRAYFHSLVFPTTHVQNLTTLLLSMIPFFALTLVSFLPISNFKTSDFSFHQKALSRTERSALQAILVTTFFVFLLFLSLLGTRISDLLVNSILLGNISGSENLYLARTQAFDNINFVQGGLLYGTLPALTAGLLEYNGPKKFIVRMITATTGALVVFLNLGLYQIAPLFAFLFILTLTQLLRSPRKGIILRYATLGGLVFLGYSVYSSLKVTGGLSSVADSLLQIVMRMPVASPYLVDMKAQYAGSIVTSDYVPRLLGYHMFPDFMARGADISMPQPSFLVTWYHFGALASLSVFCIALILPFWLSKILMKSTRGFAGFQGAVLTYSLCHYAYYLFQTSHVETFVSSYGIIFPLIPYFIFSVTSQLSRSNG
jgi:hypothetical protein